MSRRAFLLAFASLSLVLTAALALLAFGPDRVRSASAPPVPLLWKVSDGDNAVYLLGSFHLLRKSDYPLSADVEAAFADAEALLFELAPEELESPALGQRMLEAARRGDGRQLDDELGPAMSAELRAWLDDNASRLGPAAHEVQRYEPWFVSLLIALTEVGKQGLDPALGLDRHLGARAREAGKPTAGLETGAQQVAFLDGLSPDDQRQMLEEALTDAADPAQIERLHAAWRRGDADLLWTEMGQDMRRTHPALYRRINTERNLSWLPALEARLAPAAGREDTLAVVGALHLLGDDGLPALLRARGYTVRRICTECAQPPTH